jgi:hypothetical protein
VIKTADRSKITPPRRTDHHEHDQLRLRGIEPKVGPDGRLLRTETETVTFSEIVPAGGQR